MLNDKTAGIDCINCGFEKVVTNRADSDLLQNSLEWAENGSAVCPECGNSVNYEDYIDGEIRAQEAGDEPTNS